MIVDVILEKQILDDIFHAYGSWSCPNWSFVSKRYAAQPYANLVRELAALGTIHETTDLNYDLALVLCVETDGGSSFNLRLSLVGKYACISHRDEMFLTKEAIVSDYVGKGLDRLLGEHDITLLEPDMLDVEIDFEGGKITLFNALFDAGLTPN